MPKVLLVEDEALVRMMAEEDLSELGYTVVAAATGDQACALIDDGLSFDVLVTDIRMPGAVDGWELARRVRARHPEMRIIYVSGFPGDAPSPVADSLFIKKPYRIEQLSDALEGVGGLN